MKSNSARGRKISFLHRQSLRRIEDLHALDSCRAKAMQSVLEERNPNVLASSSTVVPVDVSRVALAENLETAPPSLGSFSFRTAICAACRSCLH